MVRLKFISDGGPFFSNRGLHHRKVGFLVLGVHADFYELVGSLACPNNNKLRHEIQGEGENRGHTPSSHRIIFVYYHLCICGAARVTGALRTCKSSIAQFRYVAR